MRITIAQVNRGNARWPIASLARFHTRTTGNCAAIREVLFDVDRRGICIGEKRSPFCPPNLLATRQISRYRSGRANNPDARGSPRRRYRAYRGGRWDSLSRRWRCGPKYRGLQHPPCRNKALCNCLTVLGRKGKSLAEAYWFTKKAKSFPHRNTRGDFRKFRNMCPARTAGTMTPESSDSQGATTRTSSTHQCRYQCQSPQQ